jgi:hypothetical protein
MRDLKWCPTFSKLKTLELGEWCLAADLDALILFLRHSPILEKLTLHVPPLEEVFLSSIAVCAINFEIQKYSVKYLICCRYAKIQWR